MTKPIAQKKIITRLEPLIHQYDFVYSPYNNVALVGGYGCGKSEAGVMRTLNKKFMYPENRVGYYMPTFDLLTLEVFPRFEEELDKLKIRHKVNKSRFFIDIKNKGQILFRSMDRPEKIISYQHGDCIIDELDTLTKVKAKEVFRKIIGRNRQIKPNNAPNTTGNVTTPEGYRFLFENWNDLLDGDKRIRNEDLSYQVIHASTRDNPHVNMSYIKQLISMYTSEQQKAYIEGKFINMTTGTVYSYYDKNTHNSKETIIIFKDYYEPLYIGADFNIGGCTNSISVQRGEAFHMVDEMITHDTFIMAEELFTKYQKHEIYLFPDASGESRRDNAKRSSIQILRDVAIEKGVRLEIIKDNSNPDIIDSVNAVNNAFEKKKWFINSERCPRHAEAFEQHAWDEKTERPEKFTEHPSIDDFTDNTRYKICKIFPVHRPKATSTHTGQEKAIQV